MRSSTIFALVLAVACGKRTVEPSQLPVEPTRLPAPTSQGFSASFTVCASGLGAIASDPGGAFKACGPLVGAGPCRASWDTAVDRGEVTAVLAPMIEACATQHCPALGAPTPRACTLRPGAWAGAEVAIWSELHAAILGAVFSDEIAVPPALVTRVQSLPELPTVDQLQEVLVILQRADPTHAAVPGRIAVFNVTAKLLAATFFVPSAKLAMQVDLPPCPELRVVLSRDRLTHTRGDQIDVSFGGGALDPAAVGAAFGARARQCIGAVVIAVADDTRYEDVIRVMDEAQQQGFVVIDLDDGDDATKQPAPAPSPVATMTDAERAQVRIVKVTLSEVVIGDRTIALGAVDLQAQLEAALTAALAAGATPGSIILQADRDTAGKTVNAVVRAAHRTGFDDLLFAVKKAP